jgi:hemerythrin
MWAAASAPLPVPRRIVMPIIEWNAGFLLGHPEIDQQREHLVELLNRTYDDFRGGINIEPSVLDELIDYATKNFALEESWLTEISYPELAGHKGEHQLFVARVLEFKKSLKPNGNNSVEILWFLCNWVTHHLGETDAKLESFIGARKIHQRINKKIK